jgi:hypothetical protein
MNMRTYNDWDDDIIHSKRFTEIFRKHRREFDFKFWDSGIKGGDYETLCRAIDYTLNFYTKDRTNYSVIRKTIVHESNICKQLSPFGDSIDFENNVFIDFIDLFDVTDITGVIAYAICARINNVSTYDIVNSFESEVAKRVAKEVVVSYDNLQWTCYNKDVVKEAQLQEMLQSVQGKEQDRD